MDVSPSEISSLIAAYRVPGWCHVTADSIRLTRICQGNINKTYKIERVSQGVTGEKDATRCLIYKTYGEGVYDEVARKQFPRNNALIQSLICHEVSQRGWGPKLYAAMDTGRLEEYIDSHTLTSDEAFSPAIRDDLAIAYARFHSLDLPLDKTPRDFMSDILSFNRGRNGLADWLKSVSLDDQDRRSFESLLHHDHFNEHQWLKSIGDKISHRTVMSTSDPGFVNRLVRSEMPSNCDVTRCVIIDFDISGYAHRGFDLGGHFASTTPYPAKEDRRLFLSAYRNECKLHLRDYDGDGIDSIDNLMLESYFYSLVFTFWLISFSVNMHEVFHQTPQLGSFFDSVNSLYQQLKEAFSAEYPHLLPEDAERNSSGHEPQQLHPG